MSNTKKKQDFGDIETKWPELFLKNIHPINSLDIIKIQDTTKCYMMLFHEPKNGVKTV